jgi:hypothetical protein
VTERTLRLTPHALFLLWAAPAVQGFATRFPSVGANLIGAATRPEVQSALFGMGAAASGLLIGTA